MVEDCLDLMGPVQVEEGTREELVSLAERSGDLSWGSEDEVKASTRRVADMLALIASSRGVPVRLEPPTIRPVERILSVEGGRYA